MHITLINTDDEVWASGLRSISATLRAKGNHTTMIFAGTSNVNINKSVIQEIETVVGDSEIIGISSMSRGSTRAKILIKELKPLGRLIVWGGMYPTLFPEDCARQADIVCRGEGEEFMLDLVSRVNSGQKLTDIPNGVFLSEEKIVINDVRPPIADLDSLPLLDFSFENEYVLDLTGKLTPNTGMRQSTGILFSGSRGCANNCTYCSNAQLLSIYKGQGRFVRKMTIPRFIELAEKYLKLFPRADHFYFTDEDFFARPVEEMRDFAATYPNQIGLPFECMASPRQITEEKMRLAIKAGMVLIDIGLESGSERVRREIFKRYIDDETQKQSAKCVNKHMRGNGNVLYFLIIGNPYEERKDLQKGITFLKNIPPPFSLRAYNLVFIPGTQLFEKACHDGLIEGLDDSAFDLDFLKFNYKTHVWKRKNLYLNSLLYLMRGKSTGTRLGYVPRGLIPFLTNTRMVEYFERHPRIVETILDFTNKVENVRKPH